MRTRYHPFLAVALVCAARADSLDDVLSRMDATAKSFKAYSADVKTVDYTKLFDDKAESVGSMRLQRTKNGVSGIVDFNTGINPFILHLNGTTSERYLPKANEIQVYNMRKISATIDQMLLLGFDVTRDEMMRDYVIKSGGAAKVGSDDTTRVVLTPKSAETLKVVKTVELWILDGKGYPIQIKETTPEGNYKLFVLSKLVLNPTLPASAFELPPAAAKAKRTKVN